MAEQRLRVIPTEFPHIDWAVDKRVPVVSGTRLRVQDVVAHHLAGRTVSEIVEQFASYSAAEIASAIAYYYEHQDGLDRLIEEHRLRAEQFRREDMAGRPLTRVQSAATERRSVS